MAGVLNKELDQTAENALGFCRIYMLETKEAFCQPPRSECSFRMLRQVTAQGSNADDRNESRLILTPVLNELAQASVT